jgi:hypothetical protein
MIIRALDEKMALRGALLEAMAERLQPAICQALAQR